MPREEESEDEVSLSSPQECTSTSQVHKQSVSAKKRGKLWGLDSLLGHCPKVHYFTFNENVTCFILASAMYNR